jgi:hypothetical protein
VARRMNWVERHPVIASLVVLAVIYLSTWFN